jgi:Immunoglobulin-like domain of bacterial spore germination/Sporulation and spore germination
MKRLVASIFIFGVVATGCGQEGAHALGPIPAEPSTSPTPSRSATPSPSPDGSPSPSGSPSPTRLVTYEVWFKNPSGLYVSHRTEPFTPAVGATAIRAVLDGPTSGERAAGLFSQITAGSRLLDLTIHDGVATVTMDGTFVSQETPAIAVGSLAQIVYTITQFESVDAVRFTVAGRPLTNFGGYELDGPQRREDFAEQLPWILVDTPDVGDRVSSPVTIAGTADVFEAVVSIAILDANGDVVSSSFTMATCGTGCRGDYMTDVRYDVDRTQQGTIRVYEVSAKDGSPINVVEIPVTLTA